MLLLKPLAYKPIAVLWSGLALSAIGDQLYTVALAWLAVRLVGPVAGYLWAAQAAATLVAALFGGLWADAWDHRRTMIGASALRAAIVLALVGAALATAPAFWMLTLTALGVAGLQAFFRPALQASRPLRHPSKLIFSGNVALGTGIVLLGLASGLVARQWLLPALMAAAAFSAVGGPMQDIPLATLRQTSFPPGDIGAVVRMFMVANYTGLLLGMLAAPVLIAAVGTTVVVVGCGVCIAGMGAVGLTRFASRA